MVILFSGLIKIIGNVYGVMKISSESMLLRLYLVYWKKGYAY